jgi:S1-C subfamily serine protease
VISNRGGVTVSRVERGAICARIGLRPGDVFRQVGQTEVATPDEFWKAVGEQRPGADATFVIQRGYFQYVVPIPL